MASQQTDSSCPLWNFGVSTNATIKERSPSTLLPPMPEMEILRSELVIELRQVYQDMCQSKAGMYPPPRESFNRWLIERKVVDKGPDPLLSSNCCPEISPSMYREIVTNIPVKAYTPKDTTNARKLLSVYASAAKTMIESKCDISEIRDIVILHANDTLTWIQTHPEASYEDYMERLAHLKRQCQPHLTETVKSSVEEICSKIYNMSCEFVKKIHEKHLEILKEHNICDIRSVPVLPVPRRVPCYSVQMAIRSPCLPTIEHHTKNEMTFITYRTNSLKINTSYFHKLEQLYKLNCRDDPHCDNFLDRVWCLLKRYKTFFGPYENEGSGLQGALPVWVFECLHRVFGVTFECFASPLNCYFSQFCSAFPDTDGYFGSRGPILDFHPLSGSFEAAPPYGEELMAAMVDHFEKLLSESQEPLSFIVYIPEWRHPPTEAITKMEASRFKRHQMTFSPREHQYRDGFQHIKPEKDLLYKATHAALVVFLQNDAGFAKWGPTPDRVKQFILAVKRT